VYLESGGGLGKTFLLQNLPAILTEQMDASDHCVAQLIDLSDLDTRDVLVLEERIIAGLKLAADAPHRIDPAKVDAAFAVYQQELQRLNQNRGALPTQALQAQEERLRLAFVEGCNTLAVARPLVLPFDTTETLSSAPAANDFLHDETPTAAQLFFTWVETVLPRLRRALTVFAGRPVPRDQRLERLLSQHNLLFGGRQQLEPLDAEGAERYLRAYGVPLQENDVAITGGLPLLLTCLAETRKGNLFLPSDTEKHPSNQKEFEAALLDKLLNPLETGLGDTHKFTNSCLQLLCYARRGVTEEQLGAYLRGEGFTTRDKEVPNPEEAEQALTTALAELKTTALVKVRPQTGRLYLHDQIYELMDERKHVLWIEEDVLTYLIDQAREELEAAEDRVARFNARSSIMYYSLMLDVQTGYQEYLTATHLLFESHDLTLALALRDDLWRWIEVPTNRNKLNESPLEFAEVVRDDAVWHVKYHLERDENERAAAIGDELLKRFQADIESDEFFKFDLSLTLGKVLARWRAGSKPRAERYLRDTLLVCEEPALKQEYLLKQRDYFRGETYLHLGYLYRTMARYEQATKSYLESRQAYESYERGGANDFVIDDPYAQVTINLAFSYLLQGKYPAARTTIRGLITGPRFMRLSPDLQALAHNVDSIIYLNSSEPIRARQSVERAWRITTERNASRRTHGLVARQYAAVLHEEIKHGAAYTAEGEPDQATSYFEDAELIFQEDSDQLHETLIEHGKYERSLALAARANRDDARSSRHFDNAAKHFSAALKLVDTGEPSVQRAELLECQAVIARMRGDTALAKQLLERCESDLASNTLPPYAYVVAGTVAIERGQLALDQGKVADALQLFTVALARAYTFSPDNRTVRRFRELIERFVQNLPPHTVGALVQAFAQLEQAPPLDAGKLLYQQPSDDVWQFAYQRTMAFLKEIIEATAEVRLSH
jgi:tetratricopeptide (TPR) repeat protein